MLQLLLVIEVTFFNTTAGDGEDKFGGVQECFDDELGSALCETVVIVGCEVAVSIWGTVKLGSELSP